MTSIHVPVLNDAGDALLRTLAGKAAANQEELLHTSDPDARTALTNLGVIRAGKVTDIAGPLLQLVQSGIACHLGRIILAADSLGCLSDAVRVIALLHARRSLRFRPHEPLPFDDEPKRLAQATLCRQADEAHLGLARPNYKTDLGRLLGAYDRLVPLQQNRAALEDFCQKHWLTSAAFHTANRCHGELLRILDRQGFKRQPGQASEEKLIFALLHGLSDWLCEYELSDRRQWIWNNILSTGGWLVAPGSVLRGRRGSTVVLSLFMHECTSRRGRRPGTTSERDVTLITEAVEVGADVLALAEAAGPAIFAVSRYNHSHRSWGHDNQRVRCDEHWSTLSHQHCFKREDVPAPASQESGEAFAWSIIGRDSDDDFISRTRFEDAIVTAARQLSRSSGGRFPVFTKAQQARALGTKLAGLTTWAQVQEQQNQGKLALTWADLADAAALDLPWLDSLRGEIEVNYPSLVQVGQAALPLTYHQGADGEHINLEVNASEPVQLTALSELRPAHLPDCLSTRRLSIRVHSIGKSTFSSGFTVSGSSDALDDLRCRVAVSLSRPSQVALPDGVAQLVVAITVNHGQGRSQTLYLVSGSTEATSDRQVALTTALAAVQRWLEAQAAQAATPYDLELDLKEAALAAAGRPSDLPDADRLRQLGALVQQHVRGSIDPRIQAHQELCTELARLRLHARSSGKQDEVKDKIALLAALVRVESTRVLLPEAVLTQGRSQLEELRAALPPLDESGIRQVDLADKLAGFTAGIKDVKGELRQERREGCQHVEALLRAQQLDQAEAALTRLAQVYRETAHLHGRGQTRRLRGGH